MKAQVIELEQYYASLPGDARKNVHIIRAKQSYIIQVRGLLDDPKWFSKAIESEA